MLDEAVVTRIGQDFIATEEQRRPVEPLSSLFHQLTEAIGNFLLVEMIGRVPRTGATAG